MVHKLTVKNTANVNNKMVVRRLNCWTIDRIWIKKRLAKNIVFKFIKFIEFIEFKFILFKSDRAEKKKYIYIYHFDLKF